MRTKTTTTKKTSREFKIAGFNVLHTEKMRSNRADKIRRRIKRSIDYRQRED